MKGTPQDYMAAGIAHFMAYPRAMTGKGPIVETLAELCNDDYFSVIELTEIRRDAVRAEAQELLRASGKEAIFAAQPLLLRDRLDLNDDDPRDRTEVIDIMKEALEEAAEWKAKAFVLVSGPDPGEAKRHDAVERLIASLKELCEISRSRGAPPVLLELSARHFEGQPRLIGPADDGRRVASGIIGYYPRFGIALDLGHITMEGESPAKAIETVGAMLKLVHIGNCFPHETQHPAYGHQHPPLGVEGGAIGAPELAGFLRALLDTGYLVEGGKKVVTIEVRPMKGQTATEAIDASKTCLDEAWALV